MSKESPDNIFEFASEKRKPAKPARPQPKVPQAPEVPPPTPSNGEDLPFDHTDVGFIIQRLREQHAELERKLGVIYEGTGLAPEGVSKFLDNPDNFEDAATYKHAQLSREHLINRLPGMRKDKLTSKEKEKQRKGKTLGLRKKWLSLWHR